MSAAGLHSMETNEPFTRPTLVERISDDHLAMLRAAIEQRRGADTVMAFTSNVIAAAYGLKPTDTVSEDGTITRA